MYWGGRCSTHTTLKQGGIKFFSSYQLLSDNFQPLYYHGSVASLAIFTSVFIVTDFLIFLSPCPHPSVTSLHNIFFFSYPILSTFPQ